MKVSIYKNHIIHGLKTGLASILSYAITKYLNMPYGYWAVISTVIVMQVYVADSINMCIYRFTGTAIGAVMGIGAIMIFPETDFWTGTALFVTTSICSFMTKYNRRYKMAAITVVIVILASLSATDRVGFGLFRICEIGIGIFCAFAVSVLVAPVKRIDLLKKNLEIQAEDCSKKYIELVQAFLSGQRHVDEDLLESLTRQTWSNQETYQMIIRHEALIYKGKVHRHLSLLVSTLGRAVEHLRTMSRALNALNGRGFKIIMEKEMEILASVTGDTLVALVRDEGTFDTLPLERALHSAEERLKSLREKGATSRFDIEKLTQFFSFYHSMYCLAGDILYVKGKTLKK